MQKVRALPYQSRKPALIGQEFEPMFAAYKGYRIIETPQDHSYEVRGADGQSLGRFPSMTAAIEAINRVLRGSRR